MINPNVAWPSKGVTNKSKAQTTLQTNLVSFVQLTSRLIMRTFSNGPCWRGTKKPRTKLPARHSRNQR